MSDLAAQDAKVEAILEAKREAARAHLQELRELLVKDDAEACKCTDAALLRYLESEVSLTRKNEVKHVRVTAAARALQATLKWRRKEGLDVVPPLRTTRCCEGCETNAFAHCFFGLGVDKRGWEVVYACPGRSGGKEPNSLVRHLILSLESIFEGPFEIKTSPSEVKALPSADDGDGAAAPVAVCAGATGGEPGSPRPSTVRVAALKQRYGSKATLAYGSNVDAPDAAVRAGAEPAAGSALPPWCHPSPAKHLVMLVDLHGFGLADLDPRVGLKCIPILLGHYPDRVAQVALCDSPWIFNGVWAMFEPLLDPVMQMKVRMLRGEAMSKYFERFLTPAQAEFMSAILKLRASPSAAAFPPSTGRVRRSLGPCDKFTREHTGGAAAEETAELV